MSALHPALDCSLERLPAASLLEFTAYAPSTDWPSAPGMVEVTADGAPRRLHFAPGRWLVVDPDEHMLSLIDAAAAAGVGTCVDVAGKWTAMALSGPDARGTLAATIDIAAVLANRGCAAAHLFDCPAVVMRQGNRYLLWVASSYAESFAAAATRPR